jgi:uncharacterized protein
MPEASLTIPCGTLFLEARLERGSGPSVAVICHPHPLYGGSMDNNVVVALQKALRDGGLGTLRFNFRGVGGSTGQHRGAQADTEDLLAVFAYVRQQGSTVVHLAGYSYGAWIGLRAMQDGLNPDTAILASPPLDFLDFRGLPPPSCPCLIALGDQDDFCAVASVNDWVSPRSRAEDGAIVQILSGCDHFYWGFERLLAEKVMEFLRRNLP